MSRCEQKRTLPIAPGFLHLPRDEKHCQQLARRIAPPFVREVPAAFRSDELSATSAAAELGIGRTRFHELYADLPPRQRAPQGRALAARRFRRRSRRILAARGRTSAAQAALLPPAFRLQLRRQRDQTPPRFPSRSRHRPPLRARQRPRSQKACGKAARRRPPLAVQQDRRALAARRHPAPLVARRPTAPAPQHAR